MARRIDGKWSRDPVPRGYSPQANAKEWCYLCEESHPWSEPCKQLLELDWVREEHESNE